MPTPWSPTAGSAPATGTANRSLDRRRRDGACSMHALALRAERPFDGRLKCCHAPLTDALAARGYRLRLHERHLGDAVAGDDVAVRQQVAGGVRVQIVKILVAPV